MTETVGQVVDADIVAVKARLAALEAAAKTDFAKVKAWISANWPHFVTWAGATAAAIKVGLVKF